MRLCSAGLASAPSVVLGERSTLNTNTANAMAMKMPPST